MEPVVADVPPIVAQESKDTLDKLVESVDEEKKEDEIADEIISTEKHSSVQIVCEIVGAFKLKTRGIVDEAYLMPYCVVDFGGIPIHTTKTANEPGRNPFWSIAKDSIFVLSATPEELFHNDLQFALWNNEKDALNLTVLNKTKVASAFLTGQDLVAKCDEELFEIDLHREANVGKLSLRCRLATEKDIQIIKFFRQKWQSDSLTNSLGLYKTEGASDLKNPFAIASSKPKVTFTTEIDETEMAGSQFINAFSSAFSSRTLYDSKSSETKRRIKPGPDPERIEETTFMTEEAIKKEVLKPSKSWIDAGSGALGKLYLEILGCTGLPNVDVGEAVGNVTDPFVCVVFEDTMVQTPVIDDELSPKWMPWTQRAYRIGIMHPTSMLYLGAFDFDLGITDHDALGRVAVNISNLQKDTEYVLTYDLFPSSHITDRKSAGSITIRLRIEFEDEKAVIMTALKPRPKFHVNVSKDKTLKCVQYTCYGEHGSTNEQSFDLTIMRSYINEIFEYKRTIGYAMKDSVESLVFWRGQVRVGDMMLPLHSYFLYWGASIFIERPAALPALLLLSVAWLMLANLVQRQQHPSPWHRCPSFWQLTRALILGESLVRLDKVEPFEGDLDAQKYENEWKERIARDIELNARKYEEQQLIDKIGDESIHTSKTMGIPIDLIERLTRYQGMMARYCEKARFVKIILTWEESIVSFWITLAFLSAGLVALFLPWNFILTWVGRIVVHGCLGPHMMLVDMYLQGKRKEKVVDAMMDRLSEQRKAARLRHQSALKLKDAKSIAFGNLSCLVPNYNLTRHYDRPLAKSYAKRLEDGAEVSVEASLVAPGQQLFGTIIPQTESDFKAFKAMESELEQKLKKLQEQINAIKKHHNELVKSKVAQSRRSTLLPESMGYELIEGDASPESISLTSSASRSTSPTQLEKGPLHRSTVHGGAFDTPMDGRDDEGDGVEIILEMEREIDQDETCVGDSLILHYRPV